MNDSELLQYAKNLGWKENSLKGLGDFLLTLGLCVISENKKYYIEPWS